MRIFGSDKLKDLMTKMGMEEGEVISHPWVSKAIERSQKAVEGHNFDIRKHLLEYDDVMNKQRERIYKERNRVLHEDGHPVPHAPNRRGCGRGRGGNLPSREGRGPTPGISKA